jgi:hypothetical protein
MTYRPSPPGARPRRAAAACALAGVLALTGCGVNIGGGADGSGNGTTCGLDGCTVTLEQGVDTKASVLGVDVELVGVTGDKVSLKVGGQAVTVPMDGDASTNVAGFDVTVESADKSKIVLKVTKA